MTTYANRLDAVAVVALAFTLTACEPVRSEAPVPVAPTPAAPAAVDRNIDLANDLAMLAAGRPSTQAELDKLAKGKYTRAAFAAYVDDLLATPDAARLAIRVLRLEKGGNWARPTMGVLDKFEQGGKTVHYLYKKCDASEAVKVKPWWNFATPILVCPQAYRPDVFGDGNAEIEATCTGFNVGLANRDTPCGCGPNLMRCAPDLGTLTKLQNAWQAEHLDTIAYVAGRDMPLQTIYSSNESFRTPLAELAYQRWRVENREIPNLERLPAWNKWPAQGKWAPRYESVPGQHAGIYTNNWHEGASDSVRLKLVDMFNDMWCDVSTSTSISTMSLIDLSFHGEVLNFRGKIDLDYLAARPGCTNCHARLDYAAQFWNGLQWAQMATHYDTRRQLKSSGPIYMRDLSDPRGEGKRSPATFVKLAVAQPEFPSCVARNFSTHVFGKAGHDSPLVEKLEQLVRDRASYRRLLEHTLDYYVDTRLAAPPASPKSEAKGGVVAMVDEHCSGCHDADDPRGPGVIAKRQEQWCAKHDCAEVALDVLVPLASRRMPKDSAMSSVERIAMIKELARYIWKDPAQRAASVEFFSRQALGGRAIHHSDVLVESIQALAPAGAKPAPVTPVANQDTFGPSLAGALGVAAAQACTSQRGTQQEQVACIKRALAPQRILK